MFRRKFRLKSDRPSKDQADPIFQVLQAASELGWKYKSLTWSPGSCWEYRVSLMAGNRE
jgi:hypothetical protein